MKAWGIFLTLTATAILLGLGCKASTEPEALDAIEIRLDAVPMLLKAADTLDVATVWATVLENGQPIADSTTVSFAASNGTIGSEALTLDGLASIRFVPGREIGVAAVIAQVRTKRDTVLISLY